MSYSRFPTRFGKYILLDRINSGGMAEVYRAKVTGAEKFQRLVAIKCMLPQLNEDQQFTTMFIDEAKLAAQLAHANVVQIYELGRINDQLYIAMELINGHDLRHIIKRVHSQRKPMPPGFAAYVLHKAAEGLDFAHRKIGVNGQPLNLVHRDVSPQNILVSYDGEVKVVDFGIAKAEVRDTETRAGVLKGKFAYMAPEQVMGGAIDRRADIFALGTVFYEVLTGKKLFHGESDFSILEKVRAADVPRLSETLPDVPSEVDAILQKALARDVDSRYAWASDLAEGLAPLLISHRTIFGAKQAKEFMDSLYADDIDLMSSQLRRYLEITEDDCVESSGEKRQPRASQIFRSSLEGGEASVTEQALQALAEVGEQATRLSDVKSVSGERRTKPLSGPSPGAPAALEVEHSGWTGVKSDGGFGENLSDGTSLLQQERSQAAEAIDSTQPARRKPQPYEDSPAAPASGLRSISPARPTLGASRGILGALVAATLVTLVAIVAVVIYSRPGSNTVVTAVPVAAPRAAIVEAPPSVEPPSPAATTVVGPGAEPGVTPPSPAAPTVAATAVEATAVEEDDDSEEGPGHRKNPKPRPAAAPKTGYLTVKAVGVKAARIIVNGKDLGYSPLLYYKVKAGKNSIKVVEEIDGRPGRVKNLDATVAPTHTRKDPLKLVVPM